VTCHSSYTGSIIRCMRRLEELLRQMCQAAKAIGNTELENKFAEGRYFTSTISRSAKYKASFDIPCFGVWEHKPLLLTSR